MAGIRARAAPPVGRRGVTPSKPTDLNLFASAAQVLVASSAPAFGIHRTDNGSHGSDMEASDGVDRRRLLTGAGAAAGIAALGAAALPGVAVGEERENAHDIVGVWFVNAVGAPFQPHLFTFHSDRTMLSSNPDAGDPHTSDSDGMGPWARGGPDTVFGAFEEINADRTTHQYVSRLRVEYTIKVDGDTFTGPAEANYFNPDGSLQQGPFPATLNGTRVALPRRA